MSMCIHQDGYLGQSITCDIDQSDRIRQFRKSDNHRFFSIIWQGKLKYYDPSGRQNFLRGYTMPSIEIQG